MKRGCAICAYPIESRCSGCSKAWYCSPGRPSYLRHADRFSTLRQNTRSSYVIPISYFSVNGERTLSKAWPKHKRLCKIYQRIAKRETISADTYCGLCGKADGPLQKTKCCKRTLCSDYGNYVRSHISLGNWTWTHILSALRSLSRSRKTAARAITNATRAAASTSTNGIAERCSRATSATTPTRPRPRRGT
jgi:hypothetical protein